MTLRSLLLSFYVALAAFVVGAADAENLGLAAYGLQSSHWDCKNFVRSFENAKAIRFSFLFNTFGNDTACLRQILADKRKKKVEIILINEPCQRNHRCGSYEFLAQMDRNVYSSKLAAHDAALTEALESYFSNAHALLAGSGADCYVSPGLESNVKEPAAIAYLISETRKIFPECKVVWNPSNNAGLSKDADIIEGHTDTSPFAEPSCIASLDGQDLKTVALPDYSRRYAACELNFLWSFAMNGTRKDEKFLDPRQRVNFSLDDDAGTFNRLLGE